MEKERDLNPPEPRDSMNLMDLLTMKYGYKQEEKENG